MEFAQLFCNNYATVSYVRDMIMIDGGPRAGSDCCATASAKQMLNFRSIVMLQIPPLQRQSSTIGV